MTKAWLTGLRVTHRMIREASLFVVLKPTVMLVGPAVTKIPDGDIPDIQ
jgi:hypothetical protein